MVLNGANNNLRPFARLAECVGAFEFLRFLVLYQSAYYDIRSCPSVECGEQVGGWQNNSEPAAEA